MPDIGYLPALQPDIAIHRRWLPGRAVLLGAAMAGAALAALYTSAPEAAQAVQAAGPELTLLLRAMAGLKLLFAAALLAAAYWRLALPAAPSRLACTAIAAAAMTAGPVLIWDMAHIRLGALLLHGGLLAGAVLLWRDPAVSDRLGVIVAQRRGKLAAYALRNTRR